MPMGFSQRFRYHVSTWGDECRSLRTKGVATPILKVRRKRPFEQWTKNCDFAVYRGFKLPSYVGDYHNKPLYISQSLLNNQHFMESKGPRFFFFRGSLGIVGLILPSCCIFRYCSRQLLGSLSTNEDSLECQPRLFVTPLGLKWDTNVPCSNPQLDSKARSPTTFQKGHVFTQHPKKVLTLKMARDYHHLGFSNNPLIRICRILTSGHPGLAK